MPSVTEVLGYVVEKPLAEWMARQGLVKAQKIAKEAAFIGTWVDQAIQADLRGLPLANAQPASNAVGEAIGNCLKAWQQFLIDHPDFRQSVTGIQTELRDGELVAHPDLELTEVARWGILDSKTASEIRPSHWAQAAKYHAMKAKQFRLVMPSFIAILRLDKKTGRYEYQELSDPLFIAEQLANFEAYYRIFQQGAALREYFRQQQEQEVLDAS